MLTQLILLGSVVAAAAAAQFSYGKCEVKKSKEPGLCIHIRNCPFLDEILKVEQQTDEQRQLLSDSQCGLDNTRQTTLVERILVCCPESKRTMQAISPPAGSPPTASRSGEEPGNVLPSIGTCGTMFENRILGGLNTSLYEFPWMVLVQYTNPRNEMGFLCGGTLINSRYVLTAGHCLKSTKLDMGNWKMHRVRLGEWDTTTSPDCEVLTNKKRTCAPMHLDIEVEDQIMHEQYVPNSIDQLNDIALLRLKETVSYTESVLPICLPVAEDVRNKNYEGFAMEVAGWGVTEDGTPSSRKKKITVDVWALKECQNKYRSYQRHISGSQLCSGGKVNIDTCQGDSGGPLMIKSDVGEQQVFFVTGVVSYGPTPCGLQGWPGVYTRVGNYIDWVETKLKA
ncbi:spaetzle-processing enzyme [Drosophila grimshawi]|uniref:CLIP domain-containing serine protease n=1 Tax=Drosophila grimshawi TaxID=7222 RepID=B4JTN1_DROGR|nr:spaetzle-processing enzyme [Drosophila grimshawi]EDV91460.1 GH17456 [Drosophila grimshawi]